MVDIRPINGVVYLANAGNSRQANPAPGASGNQDAGRGHRSTRFAVRHAGVVKTARHAKTRE
jgi:hypothetical protein